MDCPAIKRHNSRTTVEHLCNNMARRKVGDKVYDKMRWVLCPPGSIVRVTRMPSARYGHPRPEVPYTAVVVRIRSAGLSLAYVRVPGYSSEFGPLMAHEYKILELDLSSRPVVLEERFEHLHTEFGVPRPDW